MQTNVNIESLELFKHADAPIAVVVTDGMPGYENVLQTFLTDEALSAWMKEHREKFPNVDFRYLVDTLGSAIDYCIWNPFDGISIHSVIDTSIDIERKDLSGLTEIFDSYRALNLLHKGKASIADVAAHLKNKNVYFIGNVPEDGQCMEKKDMVYGKTVIRRQAADGTSYNAITAFLTEEGALHFAEKPVPVNCCKLTKLVSYFNFETSVTIEPERPLCFDFAPELFR